MNVNHTHPAMASIANAAAPIAPNTLPADGSVSNAGPHNQGSIHAANGPQTPFAGGSLADVGGSFAQGEVQIVR
jgi:microcystin-dependent protein